jgi:hypothetical protein
VVAVLSQLCLDGLVTPDLVRDAIARHGIDTEIAPSWAV